jgi:hypothetical protein
LTFQYHRETIMKKILFGVAAMALLLVGGGAAATYVAVSSASAASAPHVMVIMMENESSSAVFGNTSLPYFNGTLEPNYPELTNNFAEGHPSLPNYLEMTDGTTNGVTSDCAPGPGCEGVSPNLVSELDGAGIPWKAWMESMPSCGYTGGDTGGDDGYGDQFYAQHHNPFVYHNLSQSELNANDCPLPSASGVTTALDAASAPDFVWVTPNMLDDGHDGPLTTMDSWLSNYIPAIQASTWYKNGGNIVIEWDESATSDTSGIPNTGSAGGQVPGIVINSAEQGKANYQPAVDQAGILGSIESLYGVNLTGDATNSANGTISSLLTSGGGTTTTTTSAPTTTTTAPPSTTTTSAPGSTTSTSTTQPSTAPTTQPSSGGGGQVVLGAWTNEDDSSAAAMLNAVGVPVNQGAVMNFATNTSLAGAMGGLSNITNLGQSGAMYKIWAENFQFGDSVGDWSWVTDGSRDAYFQQAAQDCITNGVHMIRLGWEFQSLYPYGGVSAAQFKATWDHIVSLYEQVAAADGVSNWFNFIWNPDKGPSSTGDPISSYFPGKAFMGSPGVIADDTYPDATGWNGIDGTSWDLQDVVNLAQQQGMEVAIPEWGMTPTQESGWTGSGDDPSFADSLFNWAAQTEQTLGRNVYIDMWGDGYPNTNSGTWGLQNFPNTFHEVGVDVAKLKAQHLMMSGGTPAPTTPPPSPTTTTQPPPTTPTTSHPTPTTTPPSPTSTNKPPPTSPHGGYWISGADGGVFSFGSARFYGSMGNVRLNRPVVGIAATRDAAGYWEVAADGGVFSFGDARFYGCTANLVLNQPVVGMARTPDGGGYWLVAADGGVFSFGDARFYGSTGNLVLNRPVVAMVPTSDGGGYWLVAADGGLFSFGDAPFHGSLGSSPPPTPIVGVAPTHDGGGYWMLEADGVAHALGDASALGLGPRSPGLAGRAGPMSALTPDLTGRGFDAVDIAGQAFAYGDAPYFGDVSTVVPNYSGRAVGIAVHPG